METQIDNKLAVILSKNDRNFSIDTWSIETLYFIEDIFSFCMTGKIVFTDYDNVMENASFWGYHDEDLIIYYGLNEEKDVSKTFKIYKIDKQKTTHNELQKNNVYEITFVSELYFQWHFKQYSKSFGEMLTTDIMKYIMTNMVGGEFVPTMFEASNERIEYFYTGLKSPAENFKYLMERSSGHDTGQPGYLCFENRDGYNLVTLSMLMNGNVELMRPSNDDNKSYVFYTNNPYLHNHVKDFEVEGVDNSSMQQLSGGYRMGYDILRKKNITQRYTYKDGRKKYKDNILGKFEFPILDPNTTGQERYLKTAENREDFIDNIYYSNWIKQYSLQRAIMLYVKGHEQRKAGGVINIIWPSANDNETYNKNLTGKYFVKSVVHFFYKERNMEYNQKLVLMKNAYNGKNMFGKVTNEK